MQFQSLTLAPIDIHSIPWDSVVLPFGTTVDDSHGGVLKRVPTRPCILVIGLYGHRLGAVPQPRLLSPLRSSSQAFQEKRRHVSVLLPSHGTALTRRGNFFVSVRVGVLIKRAAIAHCYGARQRTGNNYQLHMGDTTAPSKLCRSTDRNVLLAIVTKWEDMDCTPGTTPDMHRSQERTKCRNLASVRGCTQSYY
jgi:hypothetical protein